MGVISFGNDRPVWGSSASFLFGLVEEAIEHVGQRDYLQHFFYKMAWMYNDIAMEELHVSELREFVTAIPVYRATYLADEHLSGAGKQGAERLLGELTTMLDAYIIDREARGALCVERDFWTLRRAAEVESREGSPEKIAASQMDSTTYVTALVALLDATGREKFEPITDQTPLQGDALKTLMAALGTYLGENFDRLENREPIFQLIEDAHASEDEVVQITVHISLCEAMVEASVNAGTWDRLQTLLGGETRRFAKEFYDFSIAPAPAVSSLSPHEQRRLNDLIDAAMADDWPKFKSLSDEPFSNEESMAEQFVESSARLRAMKKRHITGRAVKSQGTRALYCTITGKPDDPNPITLMMNSLSKRDDSLIGVWTILVMPDFS